MKSLKEPIYCPKCKTVILTESKVYCVGDEVGEVRLICLKCHTEYEPADLKAYLKKHQEELENKYIQETSKK